MAARKKVRIIKKVRESSGVWRFISLKKSGPRYVWDDRPGVYFLEWWDGPKRRREVAGQTPSDAMEAQRRKRNELVGELINGGKSEPAVHQQEAPMTLITEAVKMFLQHVRVHSPEKPRTAQRYTAVLDHLQRILGHKTFVEAITRPDIDDYKITRSSECSEQHRDRRITPRTINYEIAVFRTLFYFLIRERNLNMNNPCANFKPLKDPRAKAKRRPPTYSQDELDRIFAVCDQQEKTIFNTFLLTGLREEELCFLTWTDLRLDDLENAEICVRSKEGFSPKDYEERVIPIPADLTALLKKLPRPSKWVFPTKPGNRQTHLLRRLKEIAAAANVTGATLHKFRHTYATRLLEKGSDIVTVQKLMGHSDIETTRQYLNPHESLKRSAVNRLMGPS
ncbi:MAG: tyrosine-type recombinase/integrase [Bryobacterales bacterium]|nr:tyrosine-type recombinase/integrase [Bryobacterales bacterium]